MTYGGLHDYEAVQNQRKLDLVEELSALAAEAGITMVHLALGFVLAHPHVTSAIIGPRTMEQLLDQLPLVDRPLPDDVLDRIDALVAPGTDVFTGDAGYQPPVLSDTRLRRS